MKRVIEAPDTGVFTSHSEYQGVKAARKFFWATIRAYNDIAESHPLVAASYDDAKPNRRLGPILIEFAADVESACRHALEDDAVLLAQLAKLIGGDGEFVEGVPNEAKIVRACAAVFRERKLLPHQYFVHIKKGRPRQGAAS